MKKKLYVITCISVLLFVGCIAEKTSQLSSQSTSQVIIENPQDKQDLLETLNSENKAYPLLESFIIAAYNIPSEYQASTKYYYNYVDINNDGTDELFALIIGPYTSGSGGSSALLLTIDNGNFSLLDSFTLMQSPIVISDNTTNGYRDIIVYQSGGGTESAYKCLSYENGHYNSVNDGKAIASINKVTGLSIISDNLIQDIENNDFLTLEQIPSYSLESHVITKENIHVSYPQLVNYPGELSMGYMNQDLENAITPYIEEASNIKQALNIDYQIMYQGDDIISILFNGSQNFENGVYPIVHAVNFDLKTTTQINASNLILKDKTSRNKVDQLILNAISTDDTLETSVKGFADWMGVYFTNDSIIFYYLENDFATAYTFIDIPKSLMQPYLNTTFEEHPAS